MLFRKYYSIIILRIVNKHLIITIIVNRIVLWPPANESSQYNNILYTFKEISITFLIFLIEVYSII